MNSYEAECSLDFRQKDGFELVYRKYVSKMLLLCYQGTGDKEVAKEIVQDIFRRLWEQRNTIVLRGALENYLIRATKLEIIDFYRRQNRVQTHLDHLSVYVREDDNSTEHYINLRELQSRLRVLIDKLSNQSRNVFVMSRDKGLSNREIAKSLAISEKTVEAHMTKALTYLRKSLYETV